MLVGMKMPAAAAALLAFMAVLPANTLSAGETPPGIPVEDYALYDQIVTKKFLTSDTQLVLLERLTTARLIPDMEEPLTLQLFEEQRYFDGQLPGDLARDFVAVNQQPSRLEGRFQFAIRYRFVSGEAIEDPEVWAAVPVAGNPAQGGTVLDRLAFSRVGRSLRNDHALAYVENLRPDGTGAGFLVWFRRHGREWTVFETEVIWTVRVEADAEGPLLAP